MFCAVKFIQEEKGIFSVIKNRLFKYEPILHQINIKSYAPFYYVELTRKQCGEHYERLAKIVGHCSDFIIPVGSTVIEENEYIKKYKPLRFPSEILINTLKEITEKHNSNQLSIAVADKKGEFANCIEEIVKCAFDIRVFTENQYLYEPEAERIYESCGASIILCRYDNFNFNSDFTIILGSECKIVENNNGNLCVLKGENFEIPFEYEKIRPSGVDKILFASALYELCGVKKLEGLKYSSFCRTVFTKSDEIY